MSNLYQLYAFVTESSWLAFLKERWPDAPLVNGYRVLVFTNEDYPLLKQQYSEFEAKELTVEQTISAISENESGPFICNLDQLKQVINYFSPPNLELE